MTSPATRSPSPADDGGSRLHLPHGTILATDAMMWLLAVLTVSWLGVGGVELRTQGLAVLGAAALAVAVHAAVYVTLLRGRARYATIDEMPQVLMADLFVAVVLTVVSTAAHRHTVPVEAAVLSGTVALVLHMAARWLFLRVVELRRRPSGHRVLRTLVMGAGYGGEQAIRLMLEDRAGMFQPVGILDDDQAKSHLRISGVRVVGTWDDLGKVAELLRPDLVLLAVPSARAERVVEVTGRARALGLEVRVMPGPDEMMGAAPARRPEASSLLSTQVFRPLDVRDLLGRRAVRTDVDAIGSYLTGQRVLVTGAGGSIGSQLCREIAAYEPDRLIMLDRDESALHAVQLTLDGEAMLDSPDLVLGDLRTPGLIETVFDDVQPTIVFHAAALKHLTLTERFPEEAFLTNVAATRDLLLAAASHGVERFINISTDKAASPESVLGYSKRVAERLTSTVGHAVGPGRRFISVRFGNVLGSRGSALQTFANQLERGLPLTVTDPRMERYFMSVDEACQLVLQAGVLGSSGEVLVLDMGQAHNVEQIARRFAVLRGYPNAEVVYTHPRPGEKMSEVLFGEDEVDHRPSHPLISQTAVPPLPVDVLRMVAELRDRTAWGQRGALVRRWMTQTAGMRAPSAAPEESLGATRTLEEQWVAASAPGGTLWREEGGLR